MAAQQRDLDTQEIRGINLRLLRTFVVGTVSVCITVVGTGTWIVSTTKQNAADIVSIKQAIERSRNDIADLQRFKDKLELYFDKPKEIRAVFNTGKNHAQ